MFEDRHKRCKLSIRENGKTIYYYARFCYHCGVSGYNSRISKDANGRYACAKHMAKIKRVQKNKPRTIYDKNEIHCNEEFCEVYLYDSKTQSKIGSTIIDIEDVEFVKDFKWRFGRAGYVISSGNNKSIPMHRLLLGIKDTSFPLVDHINQVKHDNRKHNLRLVKHNQNVYNTNIRVTNNTGVKGISKPRNGLYDTRFEKNYKEIYFRESFSRFDDAVKWRLQKESLYFKEYSGYYNPTTNTLRLTYHSHDDNKQTFIEVSMLGEILQFNKL